MSTSPPTHPHSQPRSRRTPNFDRVARLYRWAEFFLLGPLLTRTREHFVREIRHARHALVLGDGDGRFLAHLLREAPQLQALAVDSSASMLRLLGARCAFAGSRLIAVQSAVTPLPSGLDFRQTDLVVTHFLLDCLSQTDVERLAGHVAATVQPGCLWVLSEFGVPRRNPWRGLGRLYVRGLYLAFRALTGLQTQSLPRIQDALVATGFHPIHRFERLKGLLYSELWQLSPPRPGGEASATQLRRP